MLPRGLWPTRDAISSRSGSGRRPRYPENGCLHDFVHSEMESRNAVCSPEAIHRPADDAVPRTKRRIRTVPARSQSPEPQKTCKTGSAIGTNRLTETAQLIWALPIGSSNVDFFNTIRTLPTFVFTPLLTHHMHAAGSNSSLNAVPRLAVSFSRRHPVEVGRHPAGADRHLATADRRAPR